MPSFSLTDDVIILAQTGREIYIFFADKSMKKTKIFAEKTMNKTIFGFLGAD